QRRPPESKISTSPSSLEPPSARRRATRPKARAAVTAPDSSAVPWSLFLATGAHLLCGAFTPRVPGVGGVGRAGALAVRVDHVAVAAGRAGVEVAHRVALRVA